MWTTARCNINSMGICLNCAQMYRKVVVLFKTIFGATFIINRNENNAFIILVELRIYETIHINQY